MSSPHIVLGVAEGASREEIEVAYKRAANRAHPDKKSGSTEAFHAVKEAYDALTADAEERAQDAERYLRAALQSIILEYSLDVDLVAAAMGDIDKSRDLAAAKIASYQRKLTRFRKVDGRIQGPDLIRRLLSDAIEDMEAAIVHEVRQISMFMLAREALRAYSDVAAPARISPHFML